LKSLEKYLAVETSALTLSLFRIIFGSILFIQSIYWVGIGFIQENIINPSLLFPFIESLRPLSDNLMKYGLNGVLIISSILIITNKFYRIGLILYLFSFSYLWLLCQGFFNNHYYLFSIFCFLLLFPKSIFSTTEKVRVPKVYLFSIQVLIVAVYIIAGINKLNPYWLFDLQPMKYVLGEIGFNNTSFFIVFFSYVGLFFDLFIGPLLLLKKTRFFAILTAICFHLMNFVIFILANGEIGVFPFVMIATLILFLDAEKLESKKLKPNARILVRQIFNKKIASFLAVFLFLQIIVPFRHIFFKGYVDYNCIGQRFSWRLKNMYKEAKPGIIDFTLLINNKKNIVEVAKFDFSGNFVSIPITSKDTVKLYLTTKQKTNLLYYPNMIPVFAQKTEKKIIDFMKEKSKSRRGAKANDFIITAVCEFSFMGRESQLLFDPSLDLTNENLAPTKTYKTNVWLNPLKQKPWVFK